MQVNLIKKHIAEINKLCQTHYVYELYLFGSMANENFTDKSDIDFLVSFKGVEPQEYFDNYMDLKERFELLFNRNIDLLEKQTIKNPILQLSIDQNKKFIYGTTNPKIAI